MYIDVVRNTLEQASLASLAIGLAIGFFFSFNPPPRMRPRAPRRPTCWLPAARARGSAESCTPALVVLLGIVAGVGSPLFGVLLLLAFAVGRAVPVALGASAMGWLEGHAALWRGQRALEIAGGLVLILSGLYMLNAYFFVLPGLAA